jgi:hypothetical protein
VSGRRHPLAWLPAFLVGLCAATAAEVAVGLLLYTGPGLMRSATTLLGVEAAALGIGMWTAPGPRPDLVDAVRRRWLLSLFAFLAATVFSASWSIVRTVGGSRLGQGLGLAFVAGLPLYACGGVLGGMAATITGETDARPGGTGAAAFLGAALGFALTGLTLPKVPTPASLLVVCLVLLSAGGLVFGSVLDTRLRILVRARRPTTLGDVRVEDRHLASSGRAARVLVEGTAVRRWASLHERDETPWDVTAFRAFGPRGEEPYELLVVGGGASSLPRAAVREHPSVRVTVSERSAPVLELGRQHMETGLAGEPDGRLRLGVGNLDDLAVHPGGACALIVVDTTAFGALGGLAGLSGSARDALCARLSEDGTMVLGPAAPEPGAWEFPVGWHVATYRRPLPTGLDELGVDVGHEEVILAARPSDRWPWPESAEGFVLDPPVGT